MADEKIQKTWTTKSGKQVTCTGTIVLSRIIDADGDKITVPCCDIYIDVDVAGIGNQGGAVEDIRKLRPVKFFSPYIIQGYTHKVGNLMLLPEQAKIIESVREDLEAHPAWIAKQAKIDKNRKEIAEMESRRGPGYCTKCHSYCYGDCEAN